jgi:ADP-heptose:LPS heptosyltransferase
VELAEARRIVVLRGGGLGDALFTVPALEALRAAAPAAELGVLGSGWLSPLLEGRPAVEGGPALVDGLWPLPDETARGLLTGDPDPSGATDALVGRVRGWSPQVAVQLHGGGRHSNGLLGRFGAALTAGTRTPDAPPVDRPLRYVYAQSEVFRWLEVVGGLGAAPVSIEPRLWLRDEERARGMAARLHGDRPLVVMHAGATDPRRRWPPAAFAAVARRLAADGAEVAVVGAAEDRAHAERLLADVPGATDLVERLDLVALAGLLAVADVVVANDSGPLHLARAVGAATVGIYWCGNLVNGGPAWRARHRPAISWRMQCPVCGLDCSLGRCPHDASFVADVPVDEVAASALDLLASPA